MPSDRLLQMADGTIVPSRGKWSGTVEICGIQRRGMFEIFPSGGSWALLFGKPLMKTFDMEHHYADDTISLLGTEKELRMDNEFNRTQDAGTAAAAGVSLTADIKQRETFGESHDFASKRISPQSRRAGKRQRRNQFIAMEILPDEPGESMATNPKAANPIPIAGVQKVPLADNTITISPEFKGTAEPEILTGFDETIFTRHTAPHKAERVEKILELVTIGPDLDSDQREQVTALVAEFADCFALSVSEIKAVPGAVHKLDIKPGSVFPTKIGNRTFSPPAQAYLNKTLDSLEAAGIIRPIPADEVKCCSPVVLAQKAHSQAGLTITELQHRVNDECIRVGLPPAHDMPPREDKAAKAPPPTSDPKWRFCMGYQLLNKSTTVRPMPQGDIRAKQHKLCGKRWISKGDFTGGFYANSIAEESQPYTAFYAGPRGYRAWTRMPFGLTGAPTSFGEMTANALGDLAGNILELLADDFGTAGDDFKQKMDNLRTILQRVRERQLSLSPQKTELFMTEILFAGERVGQLGIRPDLGKTTAIVNWAVPTDLQNLHAFTCLAGYFRPLIKDYATIAQPLTDLVRGLDIPRQKGKTAFRTAMKSLSLVGKWTPELDRAFVAVKAALTSEPVLRSPKYDGSPFIITTDGCMTGFAGVLSQWSKTALASGETVRRLHPVAFASKRTSPAEERYKPFLLEFAGLKFSLDKFSDIIYGSPVELETDCQALRDVLLNDKLNAMHARWKEAVTAHNIVDVRHRPGKSNGAADGISRRFTGLRDTKGDGHEWTVSEDWETTTGLTHDLFQVTTPTGYEALQIRFRNEPMFLSILEALLELEHGNNAREKRKAKHRARDYMIEDGKLWQIGDGKLARARSKRECVTEAEMVELAKELHKKGGHFHRDNVKLALMDAYVGTRVDRCIIKGIRDCGQCKGFGAPHIHSLLEPITRRHPFELVVSDYLSMPTGVGGYHTVLLVMDVFSRWRWGFMYRTKGTGKTTITGLTTICNSFHTPEGLMTDGGPHFNCKEVRDFCETRGIQYHITAPYSPWINGLIENGNGNLLSILRKLCAPGLGEDNYETAQWESLPKNWPLHFNEAIRLLNNRLIPSLQCSPAELMLGLVINTKPTPQTEVVLPSTETDISIHRAYIQQQALDGYAHTVEHATRRKAAFDKRVTARHPREVTFKVGDLVQVYRSDLTYTFSSTRKLLPHWSAPRRVVSRDRNSYRLETTEGTPLESTFSSRRLRLFEPQEGTKLFEQQAIQQKGSSLSEEVEEGTTQVDGDGEKEGRDILDVGDGIEGGEPKGDDVELSDEEEEELLVGNELVEEIAQEVEGSWTRRGRRYDGGGHM